jgi:LysM repeat protein
VRLWFVLLLAAPASAERYVMQRGETLEHVATAHGCTTEVVERANHVETSLVPAGRTVEVPDCGRARARDDDAKAKQALAVIDGATWIADHHDELPIERHDAGTWVGEHRFASAYFTRISSASIEARSQGRIAHASKLETAAGYLVKRPARAF